MNYTIYSDGAASMKKIGGSYIRGAGGHAFVVYDEDGTKIFEYSNGKKIIPWNPVPCCKESGNSWKKQGWQKIR